MREIILASRWFYPAGACLLIWLAAAIIAAFIGVIVTRVSDGPSAARGYSRGGYDCSCRGSGLGRDDRGGEFRI